MKLWFACVAHNYWALIRNLVTYVVEKLDRCARGHRCATRQRMRPLVSVTVRMLITHYVGQYGPFPVNMEYRKNETTTVLPRIWNKISAFTRFWFYCHCDRTPSMLIYYSRREYTNVHVFMSRNSSLRSACLLTPYSWTLFYGWQLIATVVIFLFLII